MSVYRLFDDVDHIVENFIQAYFEEATPDQLGIDACRIGVDRIMVNEESIAVPLTSAIGEFAYIDKRDRHELGNYVIYTFDYNDRVEECVDRFYSTAREEEEL